MKVILQLVLTVIPSFIRTEAIVLAGRTIDEGGLSKRLEPAGNRRYRMSSYERDLVVKFANVD